MRAFTPGRYATLVALLACFAPAAHAQDPDKFIETTVRFFANQTEAECYLFVEENEPYSAFNGDCRLSKDTVVIVLNELQGVSIPYPRSSDYTGYFYAISWNQPPVVNSVYCAHFGWPEAGPGSTPYVILGHVTNSNQNYYIPEVQPTTCNGYIPPQAVSWLNTHFVFCHQPACALWDMWATGGAGSSFFKIKRAFSQFGSYTTIQTETSVNYFNVHGSDTNLWWKVCGVNGSGETCSVAVRTRIECDNNDPPW